MIPQDGKATLLALGLGFSIGAAIRAEAWTVPWLLSIAAAGVYAFFLMGTMEEDADG